MDIPYDPMVKKTFEHPANAELLKLHQTIYDCVNKMILTATEFGKVGPSNSYYMVPVKTFDKLVCAVKNVPYTGDD